MAENGEVIQDEVKEASHQESKEPTNVVSQEKKEETPNETSTSHDDKPSTENGLEAKKETPELTEEKENGNVDDGKQESEKQEKTPSPVARKGRPRKSTGDEPAPKKMKEERAPERTSRRLQNQQTGDTLPDVDGEKELPDRRKSRSSSSGSSPTKKAATETEEVVPLDETTPVFETEATA